MIIVHLNASTEEHSAIPHLPQLCIATDLQAETGMILASTTIC